MLKALHWDRLWILASLLTVLTYGVGGFLLTGRLGPQGMAWINLFPLGSVLIAWAMYRVSPDGFGRLARELLVVYLVPVPLFAAAWALAPSDDVLRLALSAVAGVASVAVCGWRFGGDFVTFFRPAGRAPEAPP